jgi:hypothetical protein
MTLELLVVTLLGCRIDLQDIYHQCWYEVRRGIHQVFEATTSLDELLHATSVRTPINHCGVLQLSFLEIVARSMAVQGEPTSKLMNIIMLAIE